MRFFKSDSGISFDSLLNAVSNDIKKSSKNLFWAKKRAKILFMAIKQIFESRFILSRCKPRYFESLNGIDKQERAPIFFAEVLAIVEARAASGRGGDRVHVSNLNHRLDYSQTYLFP